MLNQASLDAIATARTDENLGLPLYDSYCFSQIPNAIVHCLTGAGDLGLPETVLTGLPNVYEKVVFLFIDGFGWRFIDQFEANLPFLKRFFEQGVVSQLTTQFPSTTAVHTTTIHTGLPVGKTGVVEWNYYEPTLDRIISPLLFSFCGDQQRETLSHVGVDPKTLFPTQTIYQHLQTQGVPSYCFQHQNYAQSPFSRTVCDGATMMPYRTVPEAIATLLQLLEKPGKGYYHLYIDSIDAICHRYGPSSVHAATEVKSVCWMLESLLFESLQANAHASSPDILILASADHGQIDVTDEKTIYLEQHCPELIAWICRDRRGELLVPSGGPRDFFLHVRENALDKAEIYLSETIGYCATIYRTQWLMEQGYFGAVGPRLCDRIGNLIVIPHKPFTIHWKPRESPKQTLGHHGGLTMEEMTIPLLACPMGRAPHR